ncbi:hypothetical protein [Bacillus sp. NPDC077027]|uniref:hypothetical protein n=1 Tax=Bacillus sp. NPDC077027 TaxID=3390548 RepID=UPI003D08E7E5
MRFKTDEANWDLTGYAQYLKTILHQFDTDTASFLLNTSFHDGYIKEMKLINHFDGPDPTTLKMIIEHSDETIYEVLWHHVRRFLFDFDITRHVYANLNEIVADGTRGIDEWGCDEIEQIADGLLFHEIELFSETKIHIVCRKIEIKRILNDPLC